MMKTASNRYNTLTKIRFIFWLLIVILFVNCASTTEKKALQINQEIETTFLANTYKSPSKNLKDNPELDSLLKLGALNNPQVKSAFYNWKATLEKIPQARTLMDPQFGYTYYIQEVETRVGPQKQKFSISQAIPWFGVLSLKGGIAFELSEQARQMYEKEKLELFFQIKDVYADYYYLGRSISILTEKFELLKQMENVARLKYASGTAMFSKLIQLQVELGRIEDMLETLKLKKIPINSRLKSLLNIQDSSIFNFPVELLTPMLSLSSSELWKKIEKNNPSLSMLDHKITMTEKKITLAKKKYYPNLMIGMNYIQTDESPMPGVMDNGKDPLMVGASINFPLQFGSLNASVKEAAAEKKMALNTKQNMENKLRTMLSMVLFKIDDSARKIKLYKENLIPRAQQSLNVIGISFRSGDAGFLDIIEAEKILLKFEDTYEKAKSEHLRSVAQLEMILGEKI